MPGQSTASRKSKNQLPAKWGVGLIVVLIIYALVQPQLNERLGWQLPSLSTLQQSQPAPAGPAQAPQSTDQPTSSTADAQQPTQTKSNDESASQASRPKPPSAHPSQSQPAQSLRYGLLRETAPDDFISPAGLRYTRGSEQGHRLAHLERHLQDDPTRPGKHGVFDGDMPQVLRWLDEAYTRGKTGAKGTSKSEEDQRTVYEVSFPKSIGYIGGRDGDRSNHPDARRIRLVVEGNKVITAFPF
jgi:hypothetical protein